MRKRLIDDDELLKMLQEGKTGLECARFFNVSPPAISKRLRRLNKPLPNTLEKLTPKEQRFCLAMAKGNTQTQAALQSYECGTLPSAKSLGSQLMARPEINLAITELMQEAGLTKRYRLNKLRQLVDHSSADICLKALDQGWKLDGSYAPQKVYGEITIRDIVSKFKNEYDDLVRRLREAESIEVDVFYGTNGSEGSD